jgi:hypothetical protein
MKNLSSSNKTKIAPELEWVRPFLECVEHLVPIARLPKIQALKGRVDKVHNFRAVIMKDELTDEIFYISLYLYVYRTKRLNPYSRYKVTYGKITILEHLAHELAHMNHWNHTPAHKKLESLIAIEFMNLLEKQGYISDEYELKHDKPNYNL